MTILYDLLNQILPMPGTTAWEIFVVVLTAILDNFLLFCMTVYGLVLVRREWCHLASMPQSELATQRVSLLKRTVVRFGVVYLVLWCVFSMVGYYSDAMARRGAQNCHRSNSPEFAAAYFAEECEVSGDRHGTRSVLRLYDKNSEKIIAEEFVSNSDWEVEWGKTTFVMRDGMGVTVPTQPYVIARGSLDEIGTYGVSIELPPSAWVRFRARLP